MIPIQAPFPSLHPAASVAAVTPQRWVRRWWAAWVCACAMSPLQAQVSEAASAASAPAPQAVVLQVPIGAASTMARLHTSLGVIEVALHAEQAPATVANFLVYARSGFYQDLIFHRVIDGFMVQTGGYGPQLKDKPTRAPIRLESDNGLSNLRGTVAMARTADPHSATSQFFINVVDNVRLDKAQARDGMGYAVFGTVVSGMEVVDAIRIKPVAPRGPHQHVPVEPIFIHRVTVHTVER